MNLGYGGVSVCCRRRFWARWTVGRLVLGRTNPLQVRLIYRSTRST